MSSDNGIFNIVCLQDWTLISGQHMARWLKRKKMTLRLCFNQRRRLTGHRFARCSSGGSRWRGIWNLATTAAAVGYRANRVHGALEAVAVRGSLVMAWSILHSTGRWFRSF
jgi:hypothetical protein